MKMILNPQQIEEESFRIIGGLLRRSKLPQHQKEIVQRVIHATTDLTYAKDLLFHPKAIFSGLEAIRTGKSVICDVSMVKAGVNARALSGFGGEVACFINDEDVVRKASQLGIARAIVAMRKAVKLANNAIISIGNAPTALFEICDLVRKDKTRPALIIGVPVGFVGAVASKKMLIQAGVPYITNLKPKGGSSVAAAITNALIKIAEER